MISVLFVDDEQNILDGLKRALRPLRKEWSSAFALGGAAALALLEQHRFDVIVTDMRMPVIDGLALLETVAVRYPSIVRIVLSGQSDVASVIKVAGITHQFLSKPCPLDVLSSTVNRAVSLRQMLGSAALVELVSKLDTIPSALPLYLELTRLLDSPGASFDDIGRLIGKDMGMCAKVLQLANSPFFGRRRSVSDPGEAAGILGLDMLRNLALALQVFKKFEPGKQKGFNSEGLWQHSFRTSLYAGAIAESLSPADRRESKQAQVAGLLHDVGQLLIACNLPQDYERILELAQQQDLDLFQAEREILGISHSEMGAYILALWGLPDQVTEAILHHHNIQAAAVPPSKVSIAVHVADAFAYEHFEKKQPLDRPVIDRDYLEGQGLGPQLHVWRELCRNLPC
jgi:putative nucleotidyltransferase with HDIG domain